VRERKRDIRSRDKLGKKEKNKERGERGEK
jgi:hypothetical protein